MLDDLLQEFADAQRRADEAETSLGRVIAQHEASTWAVMIAKRLLENRRDVYPTGN